jgi:hypothetical protein
MSPISNGPFALKEHSLHNGHQYHHQMTTPNDRQNHHRIMSSLGLSAEFDEEELNHLSIEDFEEV